MLLATVVSVISLAVNGINAGPLVIRRGAAKSGETDPATDSEGPNEVPETLERTTTPLSYLDDEGVVTLERTTTPLTYPNDPPPGGVITPCEYYYENRAYRWSEPGCKGQIAIKPGSCVCKEGLLRRESDWACVEQKRCNDKCDWVWSYLGWC